MTDVNHVAEIEFLHKRSEIVRVRVHVIARPRLTRSSVTAAIVRDTSIAVLAEKRHLVFPGVGVQRPAVLEHDRLTP